MMVQIPVSLPNFTLFLDIDGVFNYGIGIENEELNKIIVNKLGGDKNHKSSCSRCLICDKAQAYSLEKKPLAFFNRLVKKIQTAANLQIVVSSSWRRSRSVEELKEIFSEQEFSKCIIDKTTEMDPDGEHLENWKSFCKESHFEKGKIPKKYKIQINKMAKKGFNNLSKEDMRIINLFQRCRASEINEWLFLNEGYTNFLVIDDVDEHLSQAFGKRFISTDHDTFQLLTKEDVMKAYSLFLKQVKGNALNEGQRELEERAFKKELKEIERELS